MLGRAMKASSIPTIRDFYAHGKLTGGQQQSRPSSRRINAIVSIWQGDITTLAISAIVNAANSSLMGGGGVDGAIHAAAGPDLVKECRSLKGCETGDAKVTRGYNLPAKHVIHTVGPIYFKEGKRASPLLQSCYKKSLEIADDLRLDSIAFPSISTGIYGYPIQDAARVAMTTVRDYLEENKGTSIQRVIFCVFSKNDEQVYLSEASGVFPPESHHSVEP